LSLSEAAPDPDLLTDAAGTRHAPAGQAARIVSLVPSVTELLFDLGLGAQTVGRTAFCVRPRPAVKKAKSVGGTKQVNFAKLKALDPTHVVVNIDENPKGMVDAIAALGPAIVVTHPIEVEDNLRLYRLIGAVFGRAAEADALAARFAERLAALKARAARWPEKRVLYMIWRSPWMTVSADTYIARMLALANWRTLGHDPKVRYPTIDMTDALLAAADLVLFSSEPFPFKESHIEEFRRAFPGHAAKARPIDGQLVSWYGSRAVAGLDYIGDLAAALA
jgi:ABC-type Fe3+-hydroxamate transport system substrate-binding protein